jgi:hypothetical protein
MCDYCTQCTILTENGKEMPKLASLFKERYCTDQFDQCARYQVARSVGLNGVPELMLPSQVEWAQQIIKEQKSGRQTAAVSPISSSQSTQ